MLEHGGCVQLAARRYGIPAADWLDLSTGIAPDPYPVPPLPAETWQRLPEDDDGLEEAAAGYYGSARLLALSGSQAAIQALPRLRPPGRVAALAPSYAEHAAAWAAAGHRVEPFAAEDLAAAAADADAVVIVSPNNPDGARFSRERLLAVGRQLEGRGGWLVVDEAFADADPGESLAASAGGPGAENVIVLRSLGKFFGLAGARVGFALAAQSLLARLRESLGPWALSHPARRVARQALSDGPWQAEQRRRLTAASQRLAGLLADAGLGPPVATPLFCYLPTPRAAEIAAALDRRGILVRSFAEPAALRFGLPGEEAQWRRLAEALEALAGGGAP